MAFKLNKFYNVVSRSSSANKWLTVESFPTKKLAETYLLEYSKDDGYTEVDLRIEIIYRWEVPDIDTTEDDNSEGDTLQ